MRIPPRFSIQELIRAQQMAGAMRQDVDPAETPAGTVVIVISP